MFVIALVLAAAPTVGDARLITELVGSAATQPKTVDVVTGEDLRRAVDLEAERQSTGCGDSCLAEIASAMGARYVLYGSLGQLGAAQILTLSLFDSTTSTSPARTSVQGKDLGEVSAQINAAVAGLLSAAAVTTPKQKLLVLDVELKNGGALTPPPPPPPPTTNWTSIGGAGIGAAGIVVVGVGVFFDLAAVGADSDARAAAKQTDAAVLYTASENNAFVAAACYVGGAFVVAAGATVAVVGVLE